MSRTPTDIIEVEFGEDVLYSPPSGSDRWSAFRRSPIMSMMSPDSAGSHENTYGGPPPTWTIIGGWDIRAGVYIPPGWKTGNLETPATGFKEASSADGFAIEWHALAESAADGLRSTLMVIAYVDGRAVHKVIYRVPPPASIDATVICAQERRLLQSLLLVRDKRAGSGGIIKHDHGNEVGSEEFESLAVLDRRIAEVRARIAWFELAAEGNDLPGSAYW